MLTVDPVFEPYAERTEFAVRKALGFLLRSQNEDGSFPGANGTTPGVVALAGMAFLAAGHTPDAATPEGQAINRCVDYCIQCQNPENGYMGAKGGNMYSHCAATLFLAEVSGMVEPERQARLKPVLEKAVALILTSQAVPKKNPIDQGGWRYQPGDKDSDLSLSGWALMALRASRLNGAPVPDGAIRSALVYVRNQEKDNGGFRYTPDRHPTLSMTAVALLCMELCGLHGQEVTIRTGDWMIKHIGDLQWSQFREYATYYAAQAAFQLGGSYWKTCADWIYPYWLSRQGEDGAWGSSDSESLAYATSMAVLALTVPYRQLPIYQRDETVDEY